MVHDSQAEISFLDSTCYESRTDHIKQYCASGRFAYTRKSQIGGAVCIQRCLNFAKHGTRHYFHAAAHQAKIMASRVLLRISEHCCREWDSRIVKITQPTRNFRHNLPPQYQILMGNVITGLKVLSILTKDGNLPLYGFRQSDIFGKPLEA